jgi:dipeptidase E
LLKALQDKKIMDIISYKALSGTPYVGWSAGANLACPTIRTTNDMPIVDVERTRALNLVPFQINPHYIDVHPEGHGGETREMRIREYTSANPGIRVVGLREGTLIHASGERAVLKGEDGARLFLEGQDPLELDPGDVSFLLTS